MTDPFPFPFPFPQADPLAIAAFQALHERKILVEGAGRLLDGVGAVTFGVGTVDIELGKLFGSSFLIPKQPL